MRRAAYAPSLLLSAMSLACSAVGQFDVGKIIGLLAIVAWVIAWITGRSAPRVKHDSAEKMIAFFRGCANGLRFAGTRQEIHVGPIQHHSDHMAFPMIVGEKGYIVTVGEFDPEQLLREQSDIERGIRR